MNNLKSRLKNKYNKTENDKPTDNLVGDIKKDLDTLEPEIKPEKQSESSFVSKTYVMPENLCKALKRNSRRNNMTKKKYI